MLVALNGRDIDERTLFGTYGIFENPYTSFVTFFAPLVFVFTLTFGGCLPKYDIL